jgi:response regulator RpfG family c-di-GMP phosphodiesterase
MMNKLTILCVDDERNILLMLRNQLMHFFSDCKIEIAESGDEALEVIEEILSNGGDVALVIADQIMPKMKGDEFLIELHHRHPEILKVMLTGQANVEDIGNVVNRGKLYRFISKPWNETDLRLTVAEALRRYEQEKQLVKHQLALEQTNLELIELNANLERAYVELKSTI